MYGCMICLSDSPGLDIKQLKTSDTHGNISYNKMIHFCLDIQVKEDGKTRKLCTKCMDKLLDFYTFKCMALKNDKYLKSEDPECVIVSQNKELPIKAENDTKFKVGNTLITKVSSNSKKTLEIEIKLESEVNNELPNKWNNESDDDVIYDDSYSCDTSKERRNIPKVSKNVKKLPNKKVPKKTQSIKIIKNNYGKIKTDPKIIQITRPKKPVKKRPDNGVECVDCKQIFFTQSGIHEHSCSKKFVPKCVHCNTIFNTRSDLYAHNRIAHENLEIKRFLCHICSKGFAHKSQMETHISAHMNIRSHKCPHCDMSFVSTSGLNRHKLIHTDSQNYVHCKLCNRGFSNMRYLQRHQAVHDHSKRPEKKHQCTYCEQKFPSPYARRKHELTHTKHLDLNIE